MEGVRVENSVAFSSFTSKWLVGDKMGYVFQHLKTGLK